MKMPGKELDLSGIFFELRFNLNHQLLPEEN